MNLFLSGKYLYNFNFIFSFNLAYVARVSVRFWSKE